MKRNTQLILLAIVGAAIYLAWRKQQQMKAMQAGNTPGTLTTRINRTGPLPTQMVALPAPGMQGMDAYQGRDMLRNPPGGNFTP